jgi:hypothetical protein
MGYQQTCMRALTICESKFRLMEAAVPLPKWVPWDGRYNWRYIEKLPVQILVQKLARQITGLKALDMLLKQGFLQEVGVIFRVLDEIGEDIQFLSLGLSSGQWTELHENYADHFWSESEDDRIPMVRRRKIRAFVNRVFDVDDPSTQITQGEQFIMLCLITFTLGLRRPWE